MRTDGVEMAEYDYDVLVIGAGPGGYVAAIRAAQLGLQDRLRREPRDAGRHLPQRRLHPVQGAAPRVRTVRGSAPAARSPSSASRSHGAKLDLDAMHGQRRRRGQGADRRHRIPVQEEQGRLAEGPRRFTGRAHASRSASESVTREEHRHRHRLVGHAAARRRGRQEGRRRLAPARSSCPRCPSIWS